MINSFLFFCISYILTLCGFLLGKSTIEEHKEVKAKALFFSNVLIIITYLYLFFLSQFKLTTMIFLVITTLIYFLSFKEKLIEPFHNMIFLSISYILLSVSSDLELFLIPITAIFILNSFEEWDFKNETYKIILLAISFFFFSVVL